MFTQTQGIDVNGGTFSDVAGDQHNYYDRRTIHRQSYGPTRNTSYSNSFNNSPTYNGNYYNHSTTNNGPSTHFAGPVQNVNTAPNYGVYNQGGSGYSSSQNPFRSPGPNPGPHPGGYPPPNRPNQPTFTVYNEDEEDDAFKEGAYGRPPPRHDRSGRGSLSGDYGRTLGSNNPYARAHGMGVGARGGLAPPHVPFRPQSVPAHMMRPQNPPGRGPPPPSGRPPVPHQRAQQLTADYSYANSQGPPPPRPQSQQARPHGGQDAELAARLQDLNLHPLRQQAGLSSQQIFQHMRDNDSSGDSDEDDSDVENSRRRKRQGRGPRGRVGPNIQINNTGNNFGR